MHVESGYIHVAILLLLRVFLRVDNTLTIMNYLLQFFLSFGIYIFPYGNPTYCAQPNGLYPQSFYW